MSVLWLFGVAIKSCRAGLPASFVVHLRNGIRITVAAGSSVLVLISKELFLVVIVILPRIVTSASNIDLLLTLHHPNFVTSRKQHKKDFIEGVSPTNTFKH